jgi:hypothetical protein
MASTGPSLAPPLFAAALFTLIVALLAFAFQPGFLVGGGDGVETGADDRPRGLGRAAHDGGGPPGDGSDQAALKHQAAHRGDGDPTQVEKGISTTHAAGLQRL